MHYTTAPVSTLYIKVRVRKSPYANKAVAIRLTSNFYKDFKHNNVLLMREVNLGCSAEQLQLVIANMQKHVHAANVSVDIQPAVAKLFKK